MDRRIWREPAFDPLAKVLRVNWLYVMLLSVLAGVGYIALYSAAGGAPEPCRRCAGTVTDLRLVKKTPGTSLFLMGSDDVTNT